ncbi:MAG TPA: DUF3100 domain-containing protein [Candidatus Mediterraneibacter quadrami]|uniref:DUF3100 domain-containing protein n=1 Tax=Candidatus Mediterraneibacter quadrami TaxID=2838684 RepID=A0A9D2RDC7_9FIRM|nr:DUF3100 domain-containing protein [Candidatus Mediterraneibacter quadrami]
MDKFVYPSLKARLKTEYKIYIAAVIFILIADSIGQIQIPLGPGQFILFPIFYALIMGVLSGPQATKIMKSKEVKAASKLVIVAICPFIAKLGINAGASLETVVSAGPALLLQEFGNLGTILLAMPLAILLGMKREAIGATHSINRESNLALITDVYGPDSPEARGSLSIYVVGGMIGTIYFGFMVSVIAMLDIFHPYALGMASGVGAGILMASAVASLTEIFPAMADQISALASASETISGIDGIYMSLLIGLPLCNWLYKVLEPKIGRFGGKRRQEKAAAADAVEEKEAQK